MTVVSSFATYLPLLYQRTRLSDFIVHSNHCCVSSVNLNLFKLKGDSLNELCQYVGACGQLAENALRNSSLVVLKRGSVINGDPRYQLIRF